MTFTLELIIHYVINHINYIYAVVLGEVCKTFDYALSLNNSLIRVSC